MTETSANPATRTDPATRPDGLEWGIRRSFVNYIGGLSDGEFLASDGATVSGENVFHFPLDSIERFDPVSGTGVITFSGRVDVSGHYGALSLTVDRPWIEIDGSGATLTIPDPDRDPGTGHRIPLVDIVDAAEPARAGRIVAVDRATTLTIDGQGAFNQQYEKGSAMDALSYAITLPEVRRETPGDPDARLSLVVTERTQEADDVVSLRLVDPTGATLPEWTPGSHIDVHVGTDLVRQYSLSSRSSDSETWRISILKESAGAASQAIHEAFQVGSTVEVSLPRNNFVLKPSPNYVFVAGGIGITPLVPMIEAAERAGVSWNLIYSGRSRSSMAFVEELAHHGERARVISSSTEGRMDFGAYFATPQPDTLIYACGPEALLVALEEATAGWPEDSLHTERFVPKEFDDSADVEFEVEFVDSGVTATIPVGVSILAVAEEHDLPVISSCAEGTCGTCETVVLSGKPDHRDSILTESERANGDTMYICVSRSLGGCRLQLDL